MKIAIIDNYDSFTYNLSHLIKELGVEVTVLRGPSWMVRTIADTILGTKGVLHGQLFVTMAGDPSAHAGHDGAHAVQDHEHPHFYPSFTASPHPVTS